MPFRDVIGHRRLVALLARSVDRASLPPSLIFAGPSGVGKRLVAMATAQALNCLTPRRSPTADPQDAVGHDACGTCAACSRIARGLHPDVLVVEPGDTGSIKVEAIRDVVERTGYRPFEGRRRVVIIDPADALVPAAQAGLLKTLEEPPPGSVFVLITARPDVLLPTVRSRCPILRFRPLPDSEVVAALTKNGATEAQARLIAAIAAGSIGRALAATDEDVVDVRDVAVRVLLQFAAGDGRRRLEGTRDLLEGTGAGGAADRAQVVTHLRAMASLLRDTELLAVGGDSPVLANSDLVSELGRLTAFRGERGVEAFAAIDKAIVALSPPQNGSVKIVADWVAMHV